MGKLIGIAASFASGIHEIRHDYVRAVEMAGAVPVLVPATDKGSVRELVDRLDGLVIPGGPAVTRGLVGTLPDDLAETDPRRARFDESIAIAFLESGKPILGICYGMQLLNALDGGTLFADVERQLEGALAHSPKRGRESHPVEVHESTMLFDLLERPVETVNTHHIQAIAEVGASYRVSATASDGVIEAIESDDGRVLGVQFHPERMEMRAVFEWIVAASR